MTPTTGLTETTRKGEARNTLEKCPGLWRPINLDLIERMPELYQKARPCASAHGT